MNSIATQRHCPALKYYNVQGFYLRYFPINLDVYRMWMSSELFRKEVLLQKELQAYKQIQNVGLTTGEVLSKAREMLGATISDLAEMFGVSRPTIYSYMDGNEPVGNVEQFRYRLSLLETTLCFMAKFELSTPSSRILRRRDSEGKTFKELMSEGLLNKEMIEAFCLSEAETQQQIQERLKHTGINQSKRAESNPEYISVPLSRE